MVIAGSVLNESFLLAVVAGILYGLFPLFMSLSRDHYHTLYAFLFSLILTGFSVLSFLTGNTGYGMPVLSLDYTLDVLALGGTAACSLFCLTYALKTGKIKQTLPIIWFHTVIYEIFYLRSGTELSNPDIACLLLGFVGIIFIESDFREKKSIRSILVSLIALASILSYLMLKKRFLNTSQIPDEVLRVVTLLISTVILLLVVVAESGLGLIHAKTPSLINGIYLVLAAVLFGLGMLCSTLSASLFGGNYEGYRHLCGIAFPLSMLCSRIVLKEKYSVVSMIGILIMVCANFIHVILD